MNQFIEQLAARNLDESSQSLRPRLGSRFESIRPAQHDSLEESAQPTQHFVSAPPFENQRQSASVTDPWRSSSLAEESTQTATTPSPIIHQDFDLEVIQSPEPADLNPTRDGSNRLESLVGRLDQLDVQISSLGREHPEVPAPVAEKRVVPPKSEPVVQQIRQLADHHHHTHEQNVTELNPNITHYNQITNVLQSPAVLAERNQPFPVDRQNIQPPSPHQPASITTIVQQLPNPVFKQPLTGTANHTVPKPLVEPVKHKPAPAQPIPSIIVASDRNRTSEQTHTVTVTIGRIEVRAPQPPATPAPRQADKSAARIMSLDDYVKRRAGGVG